MKILSVLLCTCSAFAQYVIPITLATHKMPSASGGTDVQIEMRYAAKGFTHYLVNASIVVGGQVETTTRLVPRQTTPGFPDEIMGTYTTISVHGKPEEVRILRVRSTPVKVVAEGEKTIEDLP